MHIMDTEIVISLKNGSVVLIFYCFPINLICHVDKWTVEWAIIPSNVFYSKALSP